jgi:hypothetical protein
MVEPDAVVAAARYWGSQARVGYAEAFAPTRLVLDLADDRTASAAPTALSAPAAPDRAPAWTVAHR